MNKSRGEMLKENFGAIGWTLKKFFGFYPVMGPLAMLFMASSPHRRPPSPSIFMQKVLAVIEKWYQQRDWAAAQGGAAAL